VLKIRNPTFCLLFARTVRVTSLCIPIKLLCYKLGCLRANLKPKFCKKKLTDHRRNSPT